MYSLGLPELKVATQLTIAQNTTTLHVEEPHQTSTISMKFKQHDIRADCVQTLLSVKTTNLLNYLAAGRDKKIIEFQE